MKTYVCKICGKEFESPRSRGAYCSPECRKVARDACIARCKARLAGVTRICANCGKKYKVTNSSYRNACSRRCYRILTGKQRLGRQQRLNRSVPVTDVEMSSGIEPFTPQKMTTDEYGFRTPFSMSSRRIPLVDDGKVDYYQLLDSSYRGSPSVREVCKMPRRDRAKFSVEWTLSEYRLARSWMVRQEICTL